MSCESDGPSKQCPSTCLHVVCLWKASNMWHPEQIGLLTAGLGCLDWNTQAWIIFSPAKMNKRESSAVSTNRVYNKSFIVCQRGHISLSFYRFIDLTSYVTFWLLCSAEILSATLQIDHHSQPFCWWWISMYLNVFRSVLLINDNDLLWWSPSVHSLYQW